MSDVHGRVTVNGARIALEVHGADTARAPVVVLHGAPGIATCAQSLAAFGHLAATRRVVVYDAVGSGRSERVADLSNERWVADVEAVRDHLGADRIVLAGISYGGFLALQYAVGHPHRLAGLLLCGTSAHGALADPARDEVRRRGLPIDPGLLDRYLDGHVHDDADLCRGWSALLPLYRRGPRAANAGLAPALVNAVAHNYAMGPGRHGHDVRTRLGAITCPTLVTAGARDWIIPVARAGELAAGITGARLETFDRAGHSPFLDDPARFRQVTAEFVGGLR